MKESCAFSFRFAFELQPSGDVSEYTATITDERTKESRKGLFRVKTLTVKAEGIFLNQNFLKLRTSLNVNMSTPSSFPIYFLLMLI